VSGQSEMPADSAERRYGHAVYRLMIARRRARVTELDDQVQTVHFVHGLSDLRPSSSRTLVVETILQGVELRNGALVQLPR
jgi:hypothetical protein